MMSISENENIKREMLKLKNKVTIKVFTDFITQEDGSKNRKCMACEGTYALLKNLEEHSEGKLQLEELSTEENKGESEKFNIKRIPAILFLDDQGKEVIRYTATPTGTELVPFIKSLQYFSGTRTYFQDTITTNLKKMSKSNIKMFITQTCPYCPQTVPVLNMFASLSKGKIKAEIIDIEANPDIAMKYQVQGVPHTMINEKEHIYGMFTPQELLEKLTKGKQDLGGMYA